MTSGKSAKKSTEKTETASEKTTESVVGWVDGLRLRHGVRGDSYYYKINHQGETLEGSLRTSSLREARAKLEAMRTNLREEAAIRPGEIPILSATYKAWVAEMEATATAGHLRSVDSYWRRHLKPLLGHLPLTMVSTPLVEKCRRVYLEGGGTEGGANSLLVALNALFGWAVRHRHIRERPYAVKKLRVQQKPRPILPGELTPRFLREVDKAKNPHVRTAVRLMVGLGLREEEALTARWEWLDLRRGTYTPGQTKGREAVRLDLPDWLAEYLGKLGKKTSGLIIPSTLLDEEKRETPHRAGFTKKTIHRVSKTLLIVGLTPHRLRATFATLHSDAGTPTPEVQRMMRHKNISTTMRYVETGRQSLMEAQRKVAEAMKLQKPKEPTKEAKPPKKKAKPPAREAKTAPKIRKNGDKMVKTRK
jgi:integrase